MCRWLAYSGSPVLLEELLLKPKHSLIDQSLHSTLGAETTNGDGFGLGWYGVGETPGVFHSIEPAWNDRNLKDLARHLVSPLVFAHIRASTGGAIQQTNCHPFRHGRWLWMHNGFIARVRDGEARPHARRRPEPLRGDRGLHRHRGLLPPRAHLRARGRPAGGRRARRRLHRGDGPRARRRAPHPDDGGHDRRLEHVGVPLLERGQVAVALLQHRGRRRCGRSTRTTRSSTSSRTSRAWSCRSRSATSQARGTRCRSRATASSRRARTSCGRSRREPPRSPQEAPWAPARARPGARGRACRSRRTSLRCPRTAWPRRRRDRRAR